MIPFTRTALYSAAMEGPSEAHDEPIWVCDYYLTKLHFRLWAFPATHEARRAYVVGPSFDEFFFSTVFNFCLRLLTIRLQPNNIT